MFAEDPDEVADDVPIGESGRVDFRRVSRGKKSSADKGDEQGSDDMGGGDR